jgi:ABC-2 type transport system permease protein
MSALVIASASVRRLLRDKTSMFFTVLLPLVVILIIGSTVGGYDTFRVGVVDTASGPLGDALVADLDEAPTLRVTRFDDEDTARPALRRGEVSAVVVVPDGYDDALLAGGTADVPILVDTVDSVGQGALTAVSAVLTEQGALLQAAGFAADVTGGSIEAALPVVENLAGSVPAVAVRVDAVDADASYLPTGFSYSAPTMMVLFVFLNALAGGAAMVQTRRLGIHSRALAAPIRARDILGGEALTYLALALMQSTLIVGAGALLFGVDWGDPVAAAGLVGAWALVGTGAGMLSGALFRTPEQASSIGPAIGIALAMLGGCMWPLEIVGPVMQTIGHLTPHAWAVDGWTVLLSQGGGPADIAVQVTVLLGFAAALLALATMRLSRRLVA